MSGSRHPAPRELAEGLTRHRKAIQRYILGIVRDAAAAEELTQETFLRAYAKIADLRDPERGVAWLYRIATNLCRDRFRSSVFRAKPISLESGDTSREEAGVREPADDQPRLDKLLEQKEMGDCVQAYFAELPDTYRAAILLHDIEGMTNPEIARMLGVSLATVKMRVHRAREKLRTALLEACSLSIDERGVLVCEKKPEQTKS